MSICFNCNIIIKSVSGTINCDGCQGPLHLSCVGLNNKEAVKWTRSNSKNIKVVCNACNTNVNLFKDFKTLISSLETQFSSTIQKLKEEFQAQITDLKSTITITPQPDKYDFEDIVQEITEREKRKCNIVLFGVAEQPPHFTKDQRQEEDKGIVGDIMKEVGSNIQTTNSKIHRLGRYSENNPRPRPIKVILSNEMEAHDIIQKAKKIKSVERFKDIFLSYDKTPRQIDYYKKIKQELTERTAKGEANLRIRYSNGVPRIVTIRPLN
ncbi:hypothetical protein Zmor_008164 [Zophobas morio]|uniref:PHD-type domain-containing protein n=1 Tax=Zophobas morio TaxID=2755281 RepID=A0AA38MPG7_9CUCU|nr:hypothetical protein Zmor_008164 [Zophobas morio]